MSAARAPLALVVARAAGGVIGHAGRVPWHRSEDLRHFRRVTLGHAIIMGRKTYESIGKPLDKRLNIVVTRKSDLELGGCEVCGSLEQAIALARRSDDEPRIIGGGQIYREALPLATRIYLTEVTAQVAGDTFFELAEGDWVEQDRHESGDLVFRTLVRRA